MKIYNVQIKTMEKRRSIENGWIEIENGKIIAVEEGSPDVVGTEDLDGQGKLLIPGFIDAHTHLGIIENGIDFEGDDCNEATDPFTPQLRTIDGINPMDRCFEEAYKRGITSAVVAPGSANPCGGEIIAVKTYGRRIDDMIIKPVGIKFALGENPKRVYNDRDETPVTRMATAALIREGLTKAKRYLADIDAYEIDKENNDMPEFDLKNHALIPLLRREISAHFHCHRADDMFTAVRIAKEFDLNLKLDHVTDGSLIADELAKEGYSLAVGPSFGYATKYELKNKSFSTPADLADAGCSVCIITDSPVSEEQYLPLCAGKAIASGLDEFTALQAVTINAAKHIEVQDRVGSIEEGKDADFVLVKGSPFAVDTKILYTIIDGKIVYKNNSL